MLNLTMYDSVRVVDEDMSPRNMFTLEPTWFANVTASHQIILVLWGHGFDEIAASIFVGELRRLGKRVRLVGLNGQHIAGQHGVALVPDLPLGQALRTANRIQCIIIPAPLALLQQFSYDPRLAELLEIALSNNALIVVHSRPPDNPPLQTSQHYALSPEHLLEYPAIEELIAFVPEVLVPFLIADTQTDHPGRKAAP